MCGLSRGLAPSCTLWHGKNCAAHHKRHALGSTSRLIAYHPHTDDVWERCAAHDMMRVAALVATAVVAHTALVSTQHTAT